MPEALQKPTLSSLTASSLKTSSKLHKLQMETEPGPFQSQPEAPQQMCCQAQPAQRFVRPCKDLTGDVMGH